MKRVLPFIIIFLFPLFAHATHILGGEITYQVVNVQKRTIKATLTLYLDTGPGSVDQPDADLNFGDGTGCVGSKIITRTKINPQTDAVTYEFIHSYSIDGSYIMSFNEENRNEFINNINDGNSVDISFYVEAKIIWNSARINENSFFFEKDLGTAFIANKESSITISGFDFDGDSLGFELTTPKAFEEGKNGCGTGEAFDVPKYKLPKSISINPFSGNLKFTVEKSGLYTFAVKVSEFRDGTLVGYSIRDFQVQIYDSPSILIFERISENKVKEYEVIDLEIGKKLELEFSMEGEELLEMLLSPFSELLYFKKAEFEMIEVGAKKIGKFSLLFDSSLIRSQPYIFTARAKITDRLNVGSKDLTFILNPKLKPFIDTTKTIPPVSDPDPSTDTPTGIGEKLEGLRILASPNPTSEGFYLNTSPFPQIEILMYNSTGKVVDKQSLPTSLRAEIKSNQLPPGVYFFILQSKGERKGWGKVIFE